MPIIKVWTEDLRFCACGDPATLLRHLRDAMRALKVQSDSWRDKPIGNWTPEDQERSDVTRKALGEGALYWATAYLLDAAGLTEHGGSVPGWLTPKGVEFLTALETTPEEEWMNEE